MHTHRFGSTLRRLRTLRGWTQQDLVDQICERCSEEEAVPGLGVKTVGRWERNGTSPSPYYRKKLCQAFDMNVEELGLME
jgi:transcriptional regulator with XRE-family HTH domain